MSRYSSSASSASTASARTSPPPPDASAMRAAPRTAAASVLEELGDALPPLHLDQQGAPPAGGQGERQRGRHAWSCRCRPCRSPRAGGPASNGCDAGSRWTPPRRPTSRPSPRVRAVRPSRCSATPIVAGGQGDVTVTRARLTGFILHLGSSQLKRGSRYRFTSRYLVDLPGDAVLVPGVRADQRGRLPVFRSV